MNYNHSGARRGKPKRIVDPSLGTSSPCTQIPHNPYVYNHQQQVGANNGVPEYGFNVSETTSAYGFSPSTIGMSPTMQASMPAPGSAVPQDNAFTGSQFATQLLNEPLVANMAMKYGDALVGTGKQHLEKYFPITALKYYFAVDTDYVVVKLALLIFPFTQRVSN
uniref:Protein YIF1 n=1 Tax=Fopius arisanus TaxID=64838 RepID=A0A0C9QHL9_9HYME